MAQKQVIRRAVLASIIVLGGLCRAQPPQDLTAAGSAIRTKALAQPSSEKLKEKVSTPIEPKPFATRLTTGPRIRISPEVSSRLAKIAPDMVLRLGKAVTQVDWGTPSHSPLAPMQCGQEQTMIVTFTRTVSADQLRQRLAELIGLANPNRIDVPSLVQAELKGGKSLRVDPVSSLEQPVTSTQQGQWKWIVTAEEPGRHPLFLELSSAVRIDNERLVCEIRADELPVDITPAPGKPIYQIVWEFVKANWQWLWAAILVPIAPVLWKLLRRKRTKASNP